MWNFPEWVLSGFLPQSKDRLVKIIDWTSGWLTVGVSVSVHACLLALWCVGICSLMQVCCLCLSAGDSPLNTYYTNHTLFTEMMLSLCKSPHLALASNVETSRYISRAGQKPFPPSWMTLVAWFFVMRILSWRRSNLHRGQMLTTEFTNSAKPLSAAQDPGLKIEHQGSRMALVVG